MADQVTLNIDGIDVQVAPGTKIIEAAKKAHKVIPHFCYHEGLSVAAQCRMCFVEIEGMPKLATACSTPVAEGMKVLTNSEKVVSGQNATLEFTLLNHPLDCPICDRGGECKLQDYTYEHGLPNSRLVDPKKSLDKHRPISSEIVLDQERCILCTRCTRFSSEVDGRAQLVVNQRGSESRIEVFEERPFDSPFSGNVVDLCPVGALTAQDFRFSARPWELEKHDAICTSCSMGCNVSIHTKHRHPSIPRSQEEIPQPKIVRLMPRENKEVNEWWMCDKGRWGYHFHNKARLSSALFRRNKGEEQVEISLKEAQLVFDKVGKDHGEGWEFWISDNFPHEGIQWAKDLNSSWSERGRKVSALNDSVFSKAVLNFYAQRTASPSFAGQIDWSKVEDVYSLLDYRQMESVIPILALKLGQRVREGRLRWHKVRDFEFSEKTSNVYLLPPPKSLEDLEKLEGLPSGANFLVLWTQLNARGLIAEGIAPIESLSQTLKTASKPVFYFGQTTDQDLPENFVKYLQSAPFLVMTDSFPSKLSQSADLLLPLAPLYESKATFTSVENYRQFSSGVRIINPNIESISRGGDFVPAPLKLLP